MPSRKEQVAIISVIASASLATAKLIVGLLIGSLALISEALHSSIDLGATLVTWFAVRVSDRPPDEQHHYGHGKVEGIAALAETALLFLLAGGVAVEAVKRLQTGGHPVTLSFVPFAVLGIDMIVNAWRAWVLLKTARETKSHALEADSLHFASDFFGTIPVIIGLILAAYGYEWGDPAAALVVALLITALGVRLGKRTIDTLVDTAPAGVAPQIEAAVRRVADVVDVERVRVRTVGAQHFVDVGVRVPRSLPLDRLSAVKTDVIGAVTKTLDHSDVTVTATPTALDSETILDRVMVIARNRALAVHHVTVQAVEGRLALALDLEVDGGMPLGQAHEIATGLEAALREEFGASVEVETHIEPLQMDGMRGADRPNERVREVMAALERLAHALGPLREVHDVRVRATPDGEIVNFHCRANPELTVHAVHECVDALERGLKDQWPSVRRVIGHAEPVADGGGARVPATPAG